MTKTKYVSLEHPTILIDGVPLDIILHKLYPDELFLGLIPTITEWIDLKEEADLSRFHSDQDDVILPILMCPDDCDLTCTLIVADIVKNDNQVIWRRIGVDLSKFGTPYNYELIGTNVQWLNKVHEMRFDKHTYFECLKSIYTTLNE